MQKKRADRMCSRWMSSFAPRAPDCGLSTECLRHCATAQLRHAAARTWPAPEVQKRLSLVTFFAAAKKVTAAPHRGNAKRPIRIRGCQRSKKQKAKKPKNQKMATSVADNKKPKPQAATA